ncbi:MAG: cupin domain-containing protein [Xanthobacteraceae bacterium]
MTMTAPHDLSALFRQRGHLGPVPVFSSAQCRLIMTYLRSRDPAQVPVWEKGSAAAERFMFNLATRPRLLAVLKKLLGEDVILWGASVVERAPGQVHPWHTDIESAGPTGRFVSVWIGLENICASASLKFASRSHLAGRPFQLEAHEHGVRRGMVTDGEVRDWALKHDADAAILQPEISVGEAIFFDGRLWHASENGSGTGRTALLLQYASAATPVFIPDFAHLEWPLRLKTHPRPPVLVVSGTGSADTNQIVPAPAPSAGAEPLPPMFSSPIDPALPANGAAKWLPLHFFAAPTAGLDEMESHASVLAPDHSPHPPHTHVEEELLAVVSGQAELLLPEPDDPGTIVTRPLSPGAFVYYPAYRPHSIRNPGPAPLIYVMLKWRGAPLEHETVMQTQVWDMPAPENAPEPMNVQAVFEGPTSFLEKLHVHLTLLQPGAGYPSHVDEHDVAIVLLAGRIATNGVAHEAPSLVYFPGGAPHDMQNVGEGLARYLVFEFHKSRTAIDIAQNDYTAVLSNEIQAVERILAARDQAVSAPPPPAARRSAARRFADRLVRSVRKRLGVVG